MLRYRSMRLIEDMLKNDFQYVYHKREADAFSWHFIFEMDSQSHHLQMSLIFEQEWCDILSFISPSVLVEGDNDSYLEALKTINYINWNIKSWGRYYIDSNGDVAYSLRINYDILENMPHRFIKEVEASIEYYADLFELLLNVCQDRMTFQEAKNFIDSLWG